MMINSTAYTTITGAAAPGNFSALEGIVVLRLGAAMGRPLASAERTEWLTAYDGQVYPPATPVTAVDPDSGELLDPRCVIAWEAQARGMVKVQITYTGGWNSYGSAENPLPEALAQAIAWGVHTLAGAGQPLGMPTGVLSMKVGEWSMTRGAGAIGADGEPLEPWATPIGDLGGRCCALAGRFRLRAGA